MKYCQKICAATNIIIKVERLRNTDPNPACRHEVPLMHIEVIFISDVVQVAVPFDAAALKDSVMFVPETPGKVHGNQIPRLIENVVQSPDDLSRALLQTRYLDHVELDELHEDERAEEADSLTLLQQLRRRKEVDERRKEVEESSDQLILNVALQGDLRAQSRSIAMKLKNLGYLDHVELDELHEDERAEEADSLIRIMKNRRNEVKESSDQPIFNVPLRSIVADLKNLCAMLQGDLKAQRRSIAADLKSLGAMLLGVAALLEQADQQENDGS